MSRHLTAPFLIISLLYAFPADAQIFPFRNYTIADGLVSNNITSLFQDSRGLLWIATGDGISSFDGTNFHSYGHGDGLAFSFVNRITESVTSPGDLWVATNGGGVFRFAGGTFEQFQMRAGESTDRINIALEEPDSSLWCATDGGLVRYRAGKSEVVVPYSEIGEVYDVLRLNDSTLWFAGALGSRILNRTGRTLKSLASPVPRPEVLTTLFMDREGDVWAGSDKGSLIRFRNFQVVEEIHPGDGTVVPGLDDGIGNIWAGTHGGVVLVAKDPTAENRIVKYTEQNGLPKSPVRALLRDRENVFWLGTFLSGLAKLEERTFSYYPIAGVTFPRAAVGNGVDRSWTPARGGLSELLRLGPGRYRTSNHALEGISANDEPIGFSRGADGTLWSVDSRGTIRGYEARWQEGVSSRWSLKRTVQLPPIKPGEVPLLVFADRGGRLWCSVTGTGVLRIESHSTDPRIVVLTKENGLPDDGIRVIYEDDSSQIWFGGYSHGAASLRASEASRNGKLPTVQVMNLPDGSVRSFFRARDGRMFIGTRYGGLLLRDSSGSRVINASDGLPGSAVLCFGEDSSGAVYVGTTRGLARLARGDSTVSEVIEETRGREVYSIGFFKGGDLWMQTNLGFAVIDIHSRTKSSVPPPVYITRVEVNGSPISWTDGFELPFGQNNISIEYFGVSFRGEQPIQYRYRLEEADGDWHESTRERAVTYGSLAPGSYTFKVQAVNQDGLPSATPAQWNFSVLAPFWSRWYFILTILIIVAGASWLIIRARIRRIVEIERIRSRIATDLHDDIGASLTRITVYADAARTSLQRGSPSREGEKASELLSEVGAISRELVDSMSDVVWSVDPRNDSFDSLLLRLKTASGRLLEAKGIEYDIDIPKQLARLKLPIDFRRNFFLVFKEALNNVVRHSGASAVRIAIAQEGPWLHLAVADNGHGFDLRKAENGNGLRNIRRRAEQLGGGVEIRSEPGEGTQVRLKARLP